MSRTLLTFSGHSDAEAVFDAGCSFSFGQLEARSDRWVGRLLELGLKPGDRFAFLLPNSFEILCAYVACARSGIVGVPISQRVTPDELAFQLEDSGARALLYGRDFAEIVTGRQAETPALKHLFEPSTLDLGAEEPPPARIIGAPDDGSAPFIVMYTGGTTGRPKAAIQSRESWACCLQSSVEEWGLQTSDRHLISLPMSHAAWFTAGAALVAGGAVTILRAWDPAGVLELIEERRITTLNMIPTMLTDLLNAHDERSRDLRSVRLLTVAGSVLPMATYERACRIFGKVIGNIYGLTEAAGPVTFLHPADMLAGKSASVGRPGRFIELAILDESGAAVSDYATAGEVGLAGRQVTLGYLNRAEETRAAFLGKWFLTGDVGRLDEDGFLYIVDRSKDMIKTGGFNVYPSEIEQVLYRQPEVLECAVVGMADERWVETVHAVVVLKAGQACSGGELIARCRKALASHKVPKVIHISAGLPRTRFGKFDKRKLKSDIEGQV